MRKIAKVRCPLAELHRLGFAVKPWQPAEVIAEIFGGTKSDMRTFERDSVHGLIEIHPDAINVVAVHNEKPGNGQFAKTIALLETAADNLGITIRIVQFWNDWLLQWFMRRGYELGHNRKLGTYANRPIKS